MSRWFLLQYSTTTEMKVLAAICRFLPLLDVGVFNDGKSVAWRATKKQRIDKDCKFYHSRFKCTYNYDFV